MEEIAAGLYQFDTLLGGWEGLTAGFLLSGDSPVLIEPGAQTSAATVHAALQQLGLGDGDLAWIAVTHIHLDHAGAAGDLARAFPRAKILVHPAGLRHLADPTRLVASAGQVYGDLLDTLYGRMEPIAEERLVAAEDGLRIPVGGGRFLKVVHSPGHARHHMALLDETTWTLLSGDSVGVRLSGASQLRPAAPPPDFDMELAIDSLHNFAAINPRQLVLTHFGPVPDAQGTLAEAEGSLRHWVEIARTVTRDGSVPDVDRVEQALSADFDLLPHGMSDGDRQRLEVLNGLRSNAAGITRYLSKRHESGLQGGAETQGTGSGPVSG